MGVVVFSQHCISDVPLLQNVISHTGDSPSGLKTIEGTWRCTSPQDLLREVVKEVAKPLCIIFEKTCQSDEGSIDWERGNILLVLWGRHCRVHSFFIDAIGFKSDRDVMNILNTGKAYQKSQQRDAGPKEPDWDYSVLIAICLFLEISKLSLKFWLETFTLFDKQIIIHSQKSSKILLYEN